MSRFAKPRVRDATAVVDADLVELRRLSESRNWVSLELTGREVLLRRPVDGEVMALVAFALWQQGSLEDAAALAAESLLVTPDSYLALLTAGAALTGLGELVSAHDRFEHLIAVAPDDVEAIRRLTRSVAAIDGLEAAEQRYGEITYGSGTRVLTEIVTVRSVSEWSAATGIVLLAAGESERIPFVAPRSVDSVQGETTWALSNLPYVAELTDVRIFGNSSLILTADNTALNDDRRDARFGSAVSFEYEPHLLAQSGDRLLVALADVPTREIEAGIFLSGLASNYYGHWLPQFLPKLQFLRQHPDFASLPIIVDAVMPQSHFDHLSRLTDNPIIRIEAGESIHFGRLLVAPSPTFFPVEFLPNEIPVDTIPGLSMRAMAFLREGTTFPPTLLRTRRIYLARKNMLWRRLTNEQELVEELEDQGFESVYLEDLTLDEQITLFQEADWIVAPNGSALLNLVFADTSVKLVILTQPNVFNWGTFQGPMDALGYQSVCVRGESAVSESRKHSDYRVPLSAVRAALSSLGMVRNAA